MKYISREQKERTVKPVQTTTSIRRPLLKDDQCKSPPKQIPIQSLPSVWRDQRPLFLSPKYKKNLFKTTTTKHYPAKKWEKNKATMHKK